MTSLSEIRIELTGPRQISVHFHKMCFEALQKIVGLKDFDTFGTSKSLRFFLRLVKLSTFFSGNSNFTHPAHSALSAFKLSSK